MRRLVMLAAAMAGGFLTLSATAQAGTDDPNPCHHYLPTGQPLPRQDTVQMPLMYFDSPPSAQAHRIGFLKVGWKIDVLKECGFYDEIRIPDGVVGWVSISALPNELLLQRRASLRPAVTDADCERLFYGNSLSIETCKGRIKGDD